MQKIIKRVFLVLIVLTLVIYLGLFFYNLNRTYYNDENEIGNSAGNIYNGGLFSEQDGKIYFSNENADGRMYVMNSDCTNFKKLTDDKAVYINVDENYIYYVRANNTRENNKGGLLVFYNTGVFRINQNGSGIKAISSKPGAYLTLKGNNLYFQRYDVGIGLYLYKYQIDGDLERLMVEDAVIPAAVTDNFLYYTGYSEDHNINEINLSSYTTHTKIEGTFLYPIFTANYIYYMDGSHKYRIYRMNLDGSEATKLVNRRCSTYNITNSGKYLYYQVDDTKNNGIYRLNLETMQEERLKKGNFKQIHVTSHYVFFKDFDNTNTYVVEADGSPTVNLFEPPALTTE